MASSPPKISTKNNGVLAMGSSTCAVRVFLEIWIFMCPHVCLASATWNSSHCSTAEWRTQVKLLRLFTKIGKKSPLCDTAEPGACPSLISHSVSSMTSLPPWNAGALWQQLFPGVQIPFRGHFPLSFSAAETFLLCFRTAYAPRTVIYCDFLFAGKLSPLLFPFQIEFHID